MNQTTRYVMDIYQVGVIIRDTLEYLVTKKDGYRVDVYKQRKAVIETALNEKHALSRFLKENNETGEKIRTNIQDFYDLVYGPEARAVFIEVDNQTNEEKVIVDNGYFTQLLDYVVGLHETIFDICNGFVNFAKTNETFEEELAVLLAKENLYYRSVAGMVISDQIHRLFVEFNKAMHESKGQQTPQSNFIANDLKRNIGFFKFVEEHAHIDDDIYKLAVDKTKFVIDCMGGVQKIDETGQGLKEEILKLHDLWLKNVILTENDWKNTYTQEVQLLINYDKEQLQNAQQQANQEENNENN